MSILLVIISLIVLSLGGFQGKARQTQIDVETKNTMSALSAAITEYQANNRGNLPSETDLRSCKLLDSSDPASGASHACSYTFTTSGPDAKETIRTMLRTTCDGKVTARGYSISTLLSNGERFCIDA